MEQLKKYSDSIQKAIDQFGSQTSNVNTGIKELMVLLNAISKGFLKNESDIRRALEGVNKGQFSSAASLREYLVKLQIANGEIEKIVEYWEKISTLTDSEVEKTKDYKDLYIYLKDELEQISTITQETAEYSADQVESLEDQVDLVNSMVDKFKKFSETVQSGRAGIKALNIDLTKDVDVIDAFLLKTEEILPNLFNMGDILDVSKFEDVSKIFEKLHSAWQSGEATIKLTPKSNPQDVKDVAKELGDTLNSLIPDYNFSMEKRKKDLKSYVEIMMGYERDLSTNQLVNIQTREKLDAATSRDAESMFKTKIEQLTNISSLLENSLDLTTSEKNQLHSMLSLLTEEEKIIVGQHASYGNLAKSHKMILDYTNQQLDLYDSLNAKTEAYSNQIAQIGYDLQDVVGVIPTGLQRMLGIENIGVKVSNSINDAMTAYNGNLVKTGSRLSAMNAAVNNFGGSFMKALGPIGLVGAAIGIIYSLVSSLEGKVKNVAKEMGLSTVQSKKVVDDVLKTITASNNRLATEEDILAIQKAQVESNGRALDLSNKLNQQIVQSAVAAENAFGILSTDAMDVISLFKQLGADDTLAQTLLADIGHMSELAGIAPTIVAKDLIEGAKEVSLYFAGMPKQAAKAAIQLRRLGMSLKQAGQIADKMLNIEGFMTDMYELAAMTSGDINLSAAFDLRMQGDIEGMTKSVMDQIGSLDKFNQQNEFVQRKLASTLGMEVTDLKKSLKLKGMSNNLTTDQLELLQQNLDKVGDINSMSVDSMKAKAEELNSTKRLGAAFTKIKAVLYKALVPIAESFSELLNSSSGIIDGIGLAFRGVGIAIKIVSPIVQGFLLPFKIIGDLISLIVTKIEEIISPAETATDAFAGAKSELWSISDILKKIGITIGAFFGVKYLGKITGITKLLKSAFSPNLLDPFKLTLSNLFDPVKSAGYKLVDIFKSSGSKINDVFKNSKFGQTIIEKAKPIGSKLAEMFKNINPMKTVTDNIDKTDVGKQISNSAGKAQGLLGKLFDKINIFKQKNITESVTQTLDTKTATTIVNSPDIKNVEKTGTAFQKTAGLFKSGSELIKGSLNAVKDLVIGTFDMIKSALTSLGQGIGNFLGGIGEGLSKFQPKALIGVAAMAGIAGSVWILAKALQEFNSIDISSLGKAALAVLGVTAAMTALGSLMSSGFGAVAIGLGVVAMTAMAGALYLLGKAIQSMGSGMSTIQTSLSSIISIDFSKLGQLSVQLKEFISTSSGLQLIGDALKDISNSLSSLNIEIDKINFSKLSGFSGGVNVQNSINDSLSYAQEIKPTAMVTQPKMPEPIPISYTPTEDSSVITSSPTPSTIDTRKLEKKLDELINIFVMYSERPAYAVLPETTVKNLNTKLRGLNNR